jgi:uncharacterized protein
MQELVTLGGKPKSPGNLVPFRFRKVGGDVLLTSYFGDWVFVSEPEFQTLYTGGSTPELTAKLGARSFLKDGVDVARLAERMREKRSFLNYGPILHVMVVTLRCNTTCVYCHASRADMDRIDTDMSKETAEKCVDLILRSTAPRITIEFQGGEPLVNFPVIKHIIEYALERNRAYGKELEFTMVSNLSLMDDEKLDYLIEHKVQMCTSIDGPEKLHNKQRILVTDNAFQKASHWIRRINKRYEELGLDPVLYHVEALLTTTRNALDFPKEIVDTYVDLGCRAIFLRPVDPFGFANKTFKTIEYERSRYREFYGAALDYILELNRKGTQVLERFASIFLTKILTAHDPNFLDLRNPSGAGVGALAYNYDGGIFASDEGRMLHESGDDAFLLGHVDTAKYRDLVTHDTVRALLVASNLDALPDCVNCTYNPYCGVKPEHSYATQGSIHGRTRESQICAVHKGIQDHLFSKLKEGDPHVLETFRRWTTVRERSHFLQSSTAS